MSQEHITPEIFEKLVDLAAIALDPSQNEYLRSELNKQLTAIHELMAIPLDESTPMALHGISYTPDDRPPLREDTPIAFGNADEIISQAPVSEDRYIVVPDIPHEGLE
jgi:aspartyl/glutamyl-tRNA(Asn/Gln) amidotransferase C subunit